jgi:hypothetical protein
LCASGLRICGGLRKQDCVAVGELYDGHSATVIAGGVVKPCKQGPLTRAGTQRRGLWLKIFGDRGDPLDRTGGVLLEC